MRRVTSRELQECIDTLLRNRLTTYKGGNEGDILTAFCKAVEGVPNVHVERVPSKIVSIYYAICDGECELETEVPEFERTR